MRAKALTQVAGLQGGDVRIDLDEVVAVEPWTPAGSTVTGCRVLIAGVWVYLAMTTDSLYARM